MASSELFGLLLLLLLLLLSSARAQKLFQNCDSSGNFTANTTYQANLARLLSTLASDGYATGFLNTSVGQPPNQVYGLVNCRGDINATECRDCLATGTQEVTQVCALNKGADVWYDHCLVRFSDQPLQTTAVNRQQVVLNNVDNVAEPERFNRLLSLLLNQTAAVAANRTQRFAIGEVSNFTEAVPSIYTVLQCTRDLSVAQCGQCLRSLFEPMPKEFLGKQGGRVLGETCSMRFELYSSFFEGSPTFKITVPLENVTRPAPPSSGGLNKSTVIAIAIIIPSVSAILLFATIYICARRRTRKHLYGSLYETDPEKITSVESLLFDLRTLRVATGNFSEENKLGEGGFGVVYRGELPDGREIAVKRLLNSGQGLGELKNELVLVAKLQHRNLVKLLGVCLDKEKMIVYEFVPNRSLDKFLFDPEKGQQLSWGIRYKIIKGIARGLRYLHEESQLKIIHRDLKASNILLDTEMIPKISDFGLAKLFDSDQTQGTTNRIVGTFGYMSPEYAMHGQFSIKSDVFSFGVLVLEMLTGRKNTGSYNSEIAEDLLCKIWEKWNTGTALDILDPTLGEDYQASEVMRCIQIGLLCVQENPTDRPTMSTVVVMLNAETVSLQAPSPPAFGLGHSGMAINMGSNFSSNFASFQGSVKEKESKSQVMTPNDATVTEVEPR